MASQPVAQKRPRPRAINGRKQAPEVANPIPQPPSTRSTRSTSRAHREGDLVLGQAQGLVQGGVQSPATHMPSQSHPNAAPIKTTSQGTILAHKRKRPQISADDKPASQATSTKKGKKNPKPVAQPSSESEDEVPLQASTLTSRQKARAAHLRGVQLSNGRTTTKKRMIIDDDSDPFQTVDEYSATSDDSSSHHGVEDGDNIDLSGEDDGLGDAEVGDEGLAGILEAEQPTWNETTQSSAAPPGTARDKGKAKATSASKTPRHGSTHTSHPRRPVPPTRRLLENSFDVSSGSEFEPEAQDGDENDDDAEMGEGEQDEEWVKMVAERAARGKNKARATAGLTSRQQLEHPVWNDAGMPISMAGPSSSATTATGTLDPRLAGVQPFRPVSSSSSSRHTPVIVVAQGPPVPHALGAGPTSLDTHNDPNNDDDNINEDLPVINNVFTGPQTTVPPLVAPPPILNTVPVGPVAAPIPPPAQAPGILPLVAAPAPAGVPNAPPVHVPNAMPPNAPNAVVPGPVQPANNVPNVLPPAAYTVVLNPTGGPPLLSRQHPHIRRAIRGSVPRLEVYLVTQHAFPDTITASQFISLTMCEVAQQHGNTGLIQRINNDPDFLHSLVAIARQRASTFRLTVKKAADSHVPVHYGINPGNAVGKVVELFEWLKYIYPFTDCTDGRCTVPWEKPYLNDCVAAVLRAAFVNAGAHSMLNDHPEIFASTLAHRPEETEIPAVMAALVATAIHAAISEWRLGFHKSAPFSADAYLDIYQEHMIILNTAKEKNPRGYHTLMHRLYMIVTLQVMPTAAAGANALAHVNFAGLGA